MVAPSFEDVLITDALASRVSRPPDYQREAEAAASLAQVLADRETDPLQALADIIVNSKIADSAGVSLGVDDGDQRYCHWRAAAGLWRDEVGRRMPLGQTPTGTVMAECAAMLFQEPSRFFAQPRLEPGINEMLLVPLIVDGKTVGSVWAVAHQTGREFDREDARLLWRLSTFATIAYRLETALGEAERERAGTLSQLKDARDRLRQMIEGVPLLLWRAQDNGAWTWASPQWTSLTGQSIAASLGQGWLDPVHPDDRSQARRAWRLASSAAAFSVKYRVYDIDNDRYRWFQTRASPVRDDRGSIVEWLGTSSDIDDLETLRHQERALLAELQHRVRNTLSIVRSIARRTSERSDSVEDFRMHFDGRLSAFARAQSLVARNPMAGVDLGTLVAEEMFAHHSQEGGSLSMDGPPIRLQPWVADNIGLAIHELAVNAVKYGGLSDDDGLVRVRWEREGMGDAAALVLTWRDWIPDRPAPSEAGLGFGRELIERSLVYDLGAETSWSLTSDGVRCEIRLPSTTICTSAWPGDLP